jgi:hypothetical protein
MATLVEVQLPALLIPALTAFARRKGLSLDDVVRDWLDVRVREAVTHSPTLVEHASLSR